MCGDHHLVKSRPKTLQQGDGWITRSTCPAAPTHIPLSRLTHQYKKSTYSVKTVEGSWHIKLGQLTHPDLLVEHPVKPADSFRSAYPVMPVKASRSAYPVMPADPPDRCIQLCRLKPQDRRIQLCRLKPPDRCIQLCRLKPPDRRIQLCRLILQIGVSSYAGWSLKIGVSSYAGWNLQIGVSSYADWRILINRPSRPVKVKLKCILLSRPKHPVLNCQTKNWMRQESRGENWSGDTENSVLRLHISAWLVLRLQQLPMSQDHQHTTPGATMHSESGAMWTTWINACNNLNNQKLEDLHP